MKSELFAKILDLVAKVTELSPEQILSMTKSDDFVAARSLFVHHCAAIGIPSVSIAAFMQRKKTKSVSRYLALYDNFRKSSYYFRQMDDLIASSLSPQLSSN